MDGYLDSLPLFMALLLGMKLALFSFVPVLNILHCALRIFLGWSGLGLWFERGISSIDRRVYCIAWRFGRAGIAELAELLWADG